MKSIPVIAFCVLINLLLVPQVSSQPLNTGEWIAGKFQSYNSDMATVSPATTFYVKGDTLLIGGTFSFLVYAGDTIACYTYAEYIPQIGLFNIHPNKPDAGIYDIAVYEGTKYIGGKMWTNSAGAIGKFDSVWTDLAAINPDRSGQGAFAKFNGLLYFGGEFPAEEPLWGRHIIAWDGTDYLNVGSVRVTAGSDRANDLTVMQHNGVRKLVVGGQFSQAGYWPDSTYIPWAWHLATFDGATWDTINTVNGAYVTAVHWDSISNMLFVAGAFSSIGGVTLNKIGGYDGKKWVPLGEGVECEAYNRVMSVYHGELYIGGCLTQAGGQPVNHIARWDGQRWDNMQMGVDAEVTALGEFQDTLYVGGNFYSITSTGEKAVGIAQWYTSPCAYLKANIGIELNNDSIVQFADSSAGLWKTKWEWDFGDGNTDTAQNPAHVYDEGGSYQVRLVVSHNQCSDTAFRTVDATTGIPSRSNSSTLSLIVFPNPSSGKVTVQIEGKLAEGDLLEIINVKGEVIKNIVDPHAQTSISNLSSGIYFARVGEVVQKFVVE